MSQQENPNSEPYQTVDSLAREKRILELYGILLGKDPAAMAPFVIAQAQREDPYIVVRLEEMCALHDEDLNDSARLLEQLVAVGLQAVAGENSNDPPKRDLADTTRSGDILGPFRILEKLSEGGMGQVYLGARTDDLRMKVALKILSQTSLKMAQLFREECKILANLRHPNIAHLIDAGVERGQPWLAMEYVDGENLDQYLASKKPGLQQRLALFLEICDALSHAHQQMIIHKDLKPANIMITRDGRPKLLDFGIATSLNPETGQQYTVTLNVERIMTPAYASPEQVNGRRLSAASDVYSLGVILYEMLCGKRPHDLHEKSPLEAVQIINEAPILRPSEHAKTSMQPSFSGQIRGDLDTILLKALARDIVQRYQSVEALASDLRLYLKGLPITARPAGALYLMRKFVSRNTWPVAVSMGVVITLVAFSFYANLQQVRIGKERDLALREQRSAEHVSDFLVSLFEHVDPDLARSGDVSALEIMTLGREQIESSLVGEEVVQARLLTTMGRVYRSLGVYDEAYQLFEQAVAKEAKDPFQLHEELFQTLLLKGEYEAAKLRLDHLTDLLHDTPTPTNQALLSHCRGQLSLQRGEYSQARSALDLALEQSDFLSERRREMLYTDRGQLLGALGDFEASNAELAHLLSRLENRLGKQHSRVAATLAAMGLNYQELAQFDKAQQVFTRSTDIYLNLFGENHPSRIGSLTCLAQLKAAKADFQGAIQQQMSALELARRLLGDNHPNVAECLYSAAAYERLSRGYERAEALAREALVIFRNRLGDHNPGVAKCYNELALIFANQGLFEEAEPLYLRVIDLHREFFGEHHVQLATSLHNLGGMYVRAHLQEKAVPLLKRAISIYEVAVGGDHPHLGMSFNTLGIVYFRIRDYQRALPLLERANAIFKKHFVEDDPRYMTTLNNLAYVHQRMGHLDQAENLFRKALSLQRVRSQGPTSMNTIQLSLAKVLKDKGHVLDALNQLTELLARNAATGESNPSQLIKFWLAKAHCYRLAGDRAGAESCCDSAWQKVGKDNDKLKAQILLAKALISLEFGDLDEAIPYFNQSIRYPKDPISAGLAEELEARLLYEGNNKEAAIETMRELVEQTEGTAETRARRLLITADFSAATRPKEALALVEEAQAVMADFLGEDHPRRHWARSIEGAVLVGLGERQQGLALLEAAYGALLTRWGSAHPLTVDAQCRLAR